MKATQQQKIQARVDTMMNDTKFNWARQETTRKFIAVITIILAFASPVAFWFSNIAGLLVVAFMFVGYALLRAATRGLAEIPGEYLDERQLKIRDAVFVKAYQVLASYVAGIAIMIFVIGIFNDFADTPGVKFDFEQIQAAVWLLIGPITVIPSALMAFSKKL